MTTLKDVLPHLITCYKSIDIRTLSINHEGRFINIATKITFSMDEVAKDTKPFHKEEGVLNVITDCLHIDEYRRIKTELANGGKLKINGTEIDYLWDLDIDNFNGRFSEHTNNENAWPIFICDKDYSYISDANNPNSRITQQITNLFATLNTSHKQALLRFGHDFVYKLIKKEIKINNFETSPRLVVVLPVYARMENNKIKLTPDGKKLVIFLSHHKNVKPLLLLGEYTGGIFGSTVINNFGSKIPIKDNLISETEIEQDIELADIKECRLALDLKHIEIGESINKDQNISIRDLILKSNFYPSPLYTALSLFMPKDELGKIIENPSKSHGKNMDVEDVFEEGVAKLLNVGGMPTVWLGKYEKLYAENGNNDIGSADLLSYLPEAGMLFVISCKTRISNNKPNLLSDIINTAGKVARHINNKIYKVKPMVITNSEAGPLKKDGQENGVIVWDKKDLTRIIDTVKLSQLSKKDIHTGKVKITDTDAEDWSPW